MASCSCFHLSCFVASINMVFLELKCIPTLLWPTAKIQQIFKVVCPMFELRSRKSEVGSRKSEVGSQKTEVGSRKTEVESRKSKVR